MKEERELYAECALKETHSFAVIFICSFPRRSTIVHHRYRLDLQRCRPNPLVSWMPPLRLPQCRVSAGYDDYGVLSLEPIRDTLRTLLTKFHY